MAANSAAASRTRGSSMGSPLEVWSGRWRSTPGVWTKRSSMSHLSAVSSSRRSVSCIDTAVDAWFCAAPMAAVSIPKAEKERCSSASSSSSDFDRGTCMLLSSVRLAARIETRRWSASASLKNWSSWVAGPRGPATANRSA